VLVEGVDLGGLGRPTSGADVTGDPLKWCPGAHGGAGRGQDAGEEVTGAMARAPRLPTTNRLMAVLDTPEAADDATAALAREGVPDDAVLVLLGDRDADRIDSLGNAGGAWARARRLLSFTIADQMVDLAVYVAALRDGRTVISVWTAGDGERERAKRALAGSGAHFVNFFGRFATEDIVPWRGRELPLPPWLRR
jgi:hypothetical protein